MYTSCIHEEAEVWWGVLEPNKQVRRPRTCEEEDRGLWGVRRSKSVIKFFQLAFISPRLPSSPNGYSQAQAAYQYSIRASEIHVLLAKEVEMS